MLCDGLDLQEGLFAGVAEELIVGHTDLPQSLTDYIWILDLDWSRFNISPCPPEKQIQRTLLTYGADN
jgi:hypothetical protein